MGRTLMAFCEKCGYMLQGLPPQRCGDCQLWSCRCPECGHQQHANSTRPGLLRLIGRWRGLVFVASAFMKAALCGAMGFAWVVAGMEWRHAAANYRMWEDNEYILLVVFAVLAPWILVAALSQARHWLIPAGVSVVVIGGGFLAGMTWGLRGFERFGYAFLVFVLPWVLAGALTAWPMWRIFLWAFWTPSLQQLVVAWQGHRPMPKIESERMARRLPFGEGFPLFCESCGRALDDDNLALCRCCTLTSVRCACGHYQPVYLLRRAMEQTLARGTAVILNTVTLLMALIILSGLFAWFVAGHEWSYTYSYVPQQNPPMPYTFVPTQLYWEHVAIACLGGLLWGGLLRTLMLRWKRGWVVGLILGAITAGVFAGGMVCRYYERRSGMILVSPFTSAAWGMLQCTVVAVLIGASVAGPMWALLFWVFMPRRWGEAIIAWWKGDGPSEQIVMAERELVASPSTR